MRYQQILYYILTLGVILLSFFLYSSRFYPLLNSDDALNVLMAHYYKLPNDFYCWGQDRGGTLVPLISQIFIKLFGCSALMAVSLSNYIILVVGYIGLSSLIKSNYYKLIFAIIWFLPFQRFVDILRFPIGVEYSLIGFSMFLICKLEQNHCMKCSTKHLLYLLVVLILTMAVWVSDLSIVSIAILLVVLYLFHLLENRSVKIDKIACSYIFLGTTLCCLFIKTVKSFAVTKTENYLSINGINEFRNALLILKNNLWGGLTFSINELFVSCYMYLAILFIIATVIVLLKKKLFVQILSNKWIVFFAVDCIVVFIALLLSSWVLANGLGRRYFVATYISLSMVVLLVLDNMDLNYNITSLRWSLLLLVIVGAVSPIYSMKTNSPKSLKPMADVVGEFKQLGEIGVIAEFWNSYIVSCPDPERIKATPNEQSGVRNQKIVDMVFEKENIYVVKDMWMKTFPDTLEQFGYVLLKKGDQFRIGGCDVCKYEKIKLNKSFGLQQLECSGSEVEVDCTSDRRVLYVSADCDTCKERFVVYGPYVSIGIGDFIAGFKIKADNLKNDNPIAKLDVVADWGTTKLAEMEIDKDDVSSGEYAYIDLDFKTLKRYSNVEFRIYYYGNADLYFDQVFLKEK